MFFAKQKAALLAKRRFKAISYEQCENRASACTKRPRPPKSLAPAYSTALATAATTTLTARGSNSSGMMKSSQSSSSLTAQRAPQHAAKLHFFGNARRAGLRAPLRNARKRNHVVNLVRESERPVPTTRAPQRAPLRGKISGVGLAIANRIASPFID